MIKELIRIIPKDFFDIRIELWKSYINDSGTYMISAYSKDDYYIGDPSEIARLYEEYGICEDLSTYNKDNKCISVGYSPKNNKYYGWSHRAIRGFSIGSEVRKGQNGYKPRTIEEMSETCGCLGEDNKCTDYYLDRDSEYDIVYCSEGNCPYSLGRGEWKAESLADAKEMAMNFAYDVG